MTLDTFGLFLMLAGFVVGLGAVTVIDLHGFLGRRSSYWTEATIRTHKVTKPLIWIGMLLAIIGGAFLYQGLPFAGVIRMQAFLALILMVNGSFLSFYISPRLLEREREGRAQELLPKGMQQAIAGSFVVSFSSWWLALALLAWFLTH